MRATGSSWATRALTPVLVVVVLAVGTVVTTIAAAQRDAQARAADQAVLADRVVGTLRSRAAAAAARLDDLAGLVAAAPRLDEATFDARAAAVLRDPVFWSVAVAEVVPRARRASWEAANGPILEPAGARALRAADAPRHVVVTRSRSRSTGRWTGIDLSSDARRRPALRLALRDRAVRATGPVRLLGSGRRGVVLMAAVPGGRHVIAAGLDTARLAPVLEDVLPRGADVGVADGPVALAAVGGRPERALRRPVRVAGRTWVVTAGRRDLGPGSAPLVALFGALLTAGLGALAWQAARRERYALALVGRRLAERDASEAARDAAVRNFEAAFEDAPIGMQLVGPDGRTERVNGAMVQITGYPREQLQRMQASEIVHPDDRARDAEWVDRLVRGELEVYTGERRCLHALGDVVWVSVHATVLRDDGRGDGPRLLVQVQDVTERRRYEAQLQYLADHDPLTGLLNRRAFEREVHRHLVHAARYGPQGAVVVLDVDDFKSVNDTLGHSAGDALIIDVGHTLRTRLRESDVLARLGGDEFACLLPRVDGEEAVTVAEDLLHAIRGLRVRRGDGRTRAVASSAGVAVLGGGGADSVDDVLVQADVAMYDAKEAGGDQAALHRVDAVGEQPRMLARLAWADRIRTALEEDRFVLHAQPIVDLRTGSVDQHELLLRMVDEQGEVVPPGAFLHVAERVGLMPAIDRWVVRRAIELLAERPELVLEVNLSGASTGDAEVLRLIETGIRRHDVDAARLIFEVTETVAISNIPRAQHFATRLAQLGCRFALDDFGAGFGSFYYLKHLPFDVLKIDGEFVRHCTTSPTDQVLIKAVVDIARGLGKTTVAEHVGDDETVALLAELGVDQGQGFHLGRPGALAPATAS